jgi:hypothetical protein
MAAEPADAIAMIRLALACAALASLAGCGSLLRSTPPTPPSLAQATPAPAEAVAPARAPVPGPMAAQPPAAPSVQPEAKPTPKMEPPPEVKPTPKVEPKPKPEPKPEAKPQPKAPSKADTALPPKPEAKPPAHVETKPPPKPEPRPEASAQAKPAAPPLDLDSLERRLKETDAIGVMTKLSLKNQVDDLLDQFRDYYAGRARTTLAELRRPFDLLLMKVLSLLQDRDPALARAIHDSREALWSILADRARFEKLA